MSKPKKNKTKNSKSSKIPKKSKKSILGFLKKEGAFHIGILFATVFAFFGFGLNHLGEFFTTDEIVWLFKRLPNFLQSVSDGNYAQSTDDLGHSGVLQIWLTSNIFHDGILQGYKVVPFDVFLYNWRLPLLVFNGALLFVAYSLTRKLLNRDIALIVLVLMALFPYLIGISQIFSKDSTLWTTSYCAMISFLLYLKIGKTKYVLLSGIFLGLALLSKFPVSIFYILFFVFLYCEYLFLKIDRIVFLRKSLGLVGIYLVSVLVIYALNPAAWVDVSILLDWSVNSRVLVPVLIPFLILTILIYIEIIAIKGRMSEWLRTKFDLNRMADLLLGTIFVICSIFVLAIELLGIYDTVGFLEESPIVGNSIFIQNFIPAYFKGFKTITLQLPSLIFIGVLGMIILIVKQRIAKSKDAYDFKFITYFLLLVFAYIIGSSFSGLSPNIRYQMILLPIYALISAVFYQYYFKNKVKSKWLILSIFLISIVEVARVSPFYINYSNVFNYKDLLSAPNVNWGQGGYEIAQGANKLPDAKSLMVLSDYEGFKEFFDGSAERYDFASRPTKGFIAQFDYLSLSSNGRSQITRNNAMTPELESYYNEPLENAVWFIGNEEGYVKLVKVR